MKPRARIPDSVAAGDIVTIKALLAHRMETGERKDADGRAIPRDIIHRFEARYDGNIVFAVDIGTAIAENPFFEFSARIDRPGTFVLSWTDDAGDVTEYRHDVAVVG